MLLILATLITCFVIGCNDQQNEDSENVTNGTGEKLPGSDGGPASESDGNDWDILRFLSKSFEYDGNEHTISITGKLPDGAEVTYTGGENGKNGATNLGTYTVNATITVPGSYRGNQNRTEGKRTFAVLQRRSIDVQRYLHRSDVPRPILRI